MGGPCRAAEHGARHMVAIRKFCLRCHALCREGEGWLLRLCPDHLAEGPAFRDMVRLVARLSLTACPAWAAGAHGAVYTH